MGIRFDQKLNQFEKKIQKLPAENADKLEYIELQLEKQFQKMDIIKQNKMTIFGQKYEKTARNREEARNEQRIEQKIDQLLK